MKSKQTDGYQKKIFTFYINKRLGMTKLYVNLLVLSHKLYQKVAIDRIIGEGQKKIQSFFFFCFCRRHQTIINRSSVTGLNTAWFDMILQLFHPLQITSSLLLTVVRALSLSQQKKILETLNTINKTGATYYIVAIFCLSLI